jgi:hypothetical protein
MRASKRPRERILHVGQCTPARDRIPAAYGNRDCVAAGGLMSSGPDFADTFHQVFDLSHSKDLPVRKRRVRSWPETAVRATAGVPSAVKGEADCHRPKPLPPLW